MYEELKEILEQGRRMVFFGGAGVSTESGIPDFRSEKGLYHAVQVYGHRPEEMLSHSLFAAEPELFFRYYKENLIYADAKPNPAHLALAKLEAQGALRAVITQNIDGLHQAAGSKNVLELHGSVLRNYCLKCGAQYDLDYVLDPAHCKGQKGGEGPIPRCAVCGGMVRPDVVLYEESLDQSVLNASVRAIEEADVLIVGGTSLVVYPAAGLIRYFQGDKLVLLNLQETPYDKEADLCVHAPIGEVLSACVL